MIPGAVPVVAPGDLFDDWSDPECIEAHRCNVVEPMQHSLQQTTAPILCMRRARGIGSCGGCVRSNVAFKTVGDHKVDAPSKPWRRVDREAELQSSDQKQRAANREWHWTQRNSPGD